MVVIRLQTGNGANIAEMSNPRELIGSAKDVNWSIRGDEAVAPEHAAIVVDENDFLWVEDLGSGKITLVNGERLTGRRRLAVTDVVAIGPSTLTVSGLLPDGRVPEGSLFVLPDAGEEELKLEMQRNEVLEEISARAAQGLAFAWSDRASRQRCGGALEAADLLDVASAIRGAARVADRESSIAMDALLREKVLQVAAELQRRKDSGLRGDHLAAGRTALHAMRLAREAVHSAMAPYTGSPGFAVMIGYGADDVPPPDTRASLRDHARCRAGVVGGHGVEAARVLDRDEALAEVRLQLKELADAGGARPKRTKRR